MEMDTSVEGFFHGKVCIETVVIFGLQVSISTSSTLHQHKQKRAFNKSQRVGPYGPASNRNPDPKSERCVELFRRIPSQSYGSSPSIWDHSVTCHPTQVNVPRLLVLDLPTPEWWKAESKLT